MARKRRFGRVRRLPSGRWQARYKGPDGIDRPAPNTFATKNDAERWLSLAEAEIIKDNWLNPDAGRVLFSDYARAWVAWRFRCCRPHRTAYPALAESPARFLPWPGHRSQDVPAAKSHHEYRR